MKGGDGPIVLTTTVATIRRVDANVPSAGVIIANASGYMDFNNDAASWTTCSITKDSTTVDSSAEFVTGSQVSATRFLPFGATRGFNVTEAGAVIIRLVCREVAGTTDVSDANLTVMFFPNEL